MFPALALTGLIAATPVLADDTDCGAARATLRATHDTHVRTHEAGRRFVADHPDDFLCNPLLLPLLRDDAALFETERTNAVAVKSACAGDQHFVAEMDDFISQLDATQIKARQAVAAVESNCPAKP